MLREESGLPDDIIAERGYYSATSSSEMARLGFSQRQSIAPSLIVPLYDVDGECAGYQARPDRPRQGAGGKLVKYETPKGSRVMLDVPPRCHPLLRDPSIPLYITEGSKKADALAARGVCAISLSGVWNWRGTNVLGGKSALPDWDSVPLNERLLRIVFDSDVARKPGVAQALARLKSFLERRHAIVEIVYLPDGAGRKKQGIDDFLAAGGTIAELDAFVSDSVQRPLAVVDLNELPSILVTDRHLKDLVDDCWHLLVKANENRPFAFRRAGQLVRMDQADGMPLIRVWSEDDVHLVLERLARFERYAKEGEGYVLKPARLPTDVGKDMLAAWSKPVPPLRAIVRTPVVAADGSLSTAPGYHEASGLYYDARGKPVPDVSERPSPSDVRRARDLIDEWLEDFPFQDDASRANAIALVLTYIARELFGGPTPLVVVTAPTQGTGKGLFAQTAGVVMLGAAPAVTTEPHDGDEWRKRITAQLIQGAGMILIDNVKRRLASAELAAALTSEQWSDRLLGASEIVYVPNRAVWVATGNNVELDGEIARRSILIALDARRDRPWEGRTFRHPDLMEWVAENRGGLVWAMLILVRYWIARGRPSFSGRLVGSYESWTRVVGGILESAGVPGFLSNREELYRKADEESEEWRDFVAEWAARFGSTPVKASELADLVLEHDLLERLRASMKGAVDVQSLKIRLGKGLATREDRRFGNWFLRRAGKDAHQKGKLYALEHAEGAELDGQSSADPPRQFDQFPDSNAEGAEDAVSLSYPYARGHDEDDQGDRLHAPAFFKGGDNPPHSPHPPPSDSGKADLPAEGWADEDQPTLRSRHNPPQCVACGRQLSVVAIGDRCGRCKAARRG